MPSVKIDRTALQEQIDKIIQQNRPKITAAAREVAVDSFDEIKEEFLEDFDNNKVNEEIKEGPDTISSFLPYGNLFSFLGFPNDSDPIGKFRDFLDAEIQLDTKNPTYYKSANVNRIYFKVKIPDNDEIVAETHSDVEWPVQDSWVNAIQDGITNLSHYLYVAGEQLKGSRSHPAIQIKGTIQTNFEFNGTPYLKDIMGYLTEKLSSTVN